MPLADRTGLLDSAWRLLPDVARDDPAAANRLKAELQALVGPEGPSRELIEDWKKRFPPPTLRTVSGHKAATRAGTGLRRNGERRRVPQRWTTTSGRRSTRRTTHDNEAR